MTQYSDLVFEPVAHCPVCGGEGEWVIGMKRDEGNMIIQMSGCKDCKSSYHNPRLTEESMLAYYTSGLYRKYPERSFDKKWKTIHTGLRVDFMRDMLDMHPKRYLDVGCAQGYMVREIQKRYGCEAVGYDVYDDPEAFVPVVTDKKEVKGKFDLITCLHVMEHLYRPLEELDWMVGLCADDGLMYIEFPMDQLAILPHVINYSDEGIFLMAQRTNMPFFIMKLESVGLIAIVAGKQPFDIPSIQDKLSRLTLIDPRTYRHEEEIG